MPTVELLPAQDELLADLETPILGFAGGLGSGKTTALIHKAIQLALENQGLPGLFVEPTYPMIEDVLFEAFDAILGDDEDVGLNIPHTPRKGSSPQYTLHLAGGDTVIRLRSGENPLRVGSGSNVAWAIVDEVDQIRPETIKRVRTRVRAPKARRKQIVLAGTPEGRATMYDTFVKNPPTHRTTGENMTRLIKARTGDNHHLDELYLSTAFAGMTPDERAQFENGDFIMPRGRVYAQFADRHRKVCTNRFAGRLVMLCDFNVSPMAWTLGRIFGDELHIWGELVVDNTNTIDQTALAAETWARLLSKHYGRFVDAYEAATMVDVYCDASGAARRSSSSKTDVAWLRDAGFSVYHPAANPRVKDRVFSVNLAFSENRLFIDPSCQQTLVCFENQAWAKNGEPDKTKGHDHIPDGVGYGVHYEWPAEYPRGNTQWIQKA